MALEMVLKALWFGSWFGIFWRCISLVCISALHSIDALDWLLNIFFFFPILFVLFIRNSYLVVVKKFC